MLKAVAGIISPRCAPEMAQLSRRMVERLCHCASRVPEYAAFDRFGLHAGWTSARAVQTEAGAAWSPTRRVGLIFAGEEFTRSAAGLAASYELAGWDALRDLNGWFSGLIVDLRRDELTLFNDRYGLGRIYYCESPEGFFFASEAKSLLAVLPQTRQLDPQGVAEMLAVGCVMQNRSLYSGIRLLPPGSAWTFHPDGRVEKAQYFSPTALEQQEPLDATEYGDQLAAVFSRIAPRYLGGAARVAMSLTGGLDSRAVIAWARTEPGALPCYTFGGPYRDCADVRIARRLASLCRHPHTTIRIDENFFPRFAELAGRSVYVSDGAMDVSGSVELHVNQLAREIAPVRLTGNYGSEILRSYVAFRPGQLDRALFTKEFNRLLDAASETYREEAACHRLSFIAFKQVPWHHHARFSIERSQLTPRSPFLDNELVALAYRAPAELQTSAQPLLDVIAQGNPSLARIGSDRALRKRSVPIVSRVARSWQEFTAKAEYAYDYGMPGWLARADRAVTRLHLEKVFLGRHKFYHFRVWYRDQLRHAVRDLALGGGSETFCYRQGISRQLVDEHLSGRANRTLELHKLLSLQLIERRLLRAP
jgi:asparagine synthase (glutamine-hydrolysing)